MEAVLIYSGGLDSTTGLYWLRNEGYDVRCLSINYGQRHRKELEHAKAFCDELGIEHRVADLTAVREFLKGSSQTDDSVSVPEGHYEEETMKATVVPNRNMVMLAVATGWAVQIKSNAVAYCAHASDFSIYPDCRPVFADALNKAIGLCDWHKVELLYPFINKTKAEVIKIGHELEVPFEKTWSCYQGKEQHCGKCGTCVERAHSFEIAGVLDPTDYEDSEFWKKTVEEHAKKQEATS